MRARVITVKDVARCPVTSLQPMHYRPDGSCVCGETCEWFALCERPATVLLPHPILGEVPACTVCQTQQEEA
jgi:hypothetical protein